MRSSPCLPSSPHWGVTSTKLIEPFEGLVGSKSELSAPTDVAFFSSKFRIRANHRQRQLKWIWESFLQWRCCSSGRWSHLGATLPDGFTCCSQPESSCSSTASPCEGHIGAENARRTERERTEARARPRRGDCDRGAARRGIRAEIETGSRHRRGGNGGTAFLRGADAGWMESQGAGAEPVEGRDAPRAHAGRAPRRRHP